MKQILLILLLFFRLTSFSQPFMGIISSSGNNTVVADPTYMYGNVFQESFEGTGYQNTWTEVIGSGSIVDEDNTDIIITGGGTQVLKILKAATNAQTYTGYFATEAAIAYVDLFVYVGSYTLPSNGNLINLATFNDAAGSAAITVYIRNLSSYKSIYVSVYNNGAATAYTYPSATADLTLNHWYHIQAKYDVTNHKYKIIVDDTILANDITLTGTIRTGVKRIFLGDNTNAFNATFYLDRINISSTTFFTP